MILIIHMHILKLYKVINIYIRSLILINDSLVIISILKTVENIKFLLYFFFPFFFFTTRIMTNSYFSIVPVRYHMVDIEIL